MPKMLPWHDKTTAKERLLDASLKHSKNLGLRPFVLNALGEGISMDRIAVALSIATGEPVSGPGLNNWVIRWRKEGDAATPAGGNQQLSLLDKENQ